MCQLNRCGLNFSKVMMKYSFKKEEWQQHIDKHENMSAAIQIIIKLSKLHHCQHWLDREHVTETEFYSRYIKDNKQMSSKHQLCRGLRCETSVDQGHVFQHYFVSSDPVPMASLSPLDTGNWWHQQACSKYALVLFARYQIFGLFTPNLLEILNLKRQCGAVWFFVRAAH